MSKMTTAEKRGYQQICGNNGMMMVIACDQRGSMRTLLSDDPAVQAKISKDMLGDVKCDITQYLARFATSVLVDPACAVPRLVDESILPRDIGLLIGVDDSGFDSDAAGYRLSKLVPGITARRVRELGGTGAKIMIYLRSDKPAANEKNLDLLKSCIDDFAREDLLLVTEFLTYRLEGEEPDEYKAKTEELIVGGSRLCLEAGANILKIPYPGSAMAAADVTRLCGTTPWAVLSAGVDHATFLKQVEISMQNGASGVIAGRSLWKDCISLDRAVTKDRLTTIALPRLRELLGIIDRYAAERSARI